MTHVVNKDGLWWYEVPPPPKRHEHWAQTTGVTLTQTVRRCPCGAFDSPFGWVYLDPPRVAPSPTVLERVRAMFRKARP